LLGVIPDFRIDYGAILSEHAKIIAINRNKLHLRKNSDLFWKPALTIGADPACFVVSLSRALKNLKIDRDWITALRHRSGQVEKDRLLRIQYDDDKYNISSSSSSQLPTQQQSSASLPKQQGISSTTTTIDDTRMTRKLLNPINLLQEMDRMLPDNVIFVGDGGDFVASAAHILRPSGPLKWLGAGPLGVVGFGAGFALAAKLVQPDHHVFLISGDGSIGFSLFELDTFVRHKLPILIVVGNDARWSMSAREQMRILGSDIGTKHSYCDFQVVAQGLGAQGFLLENVSDIGAVFQKAFDSYQQGNLVLINALIGRSSFREGSIAG